MKRAFTIIELLVVVAVMGVLMGIVSVAAVNSLRDGREQRMKIMALVLEQGLETFKARAGEWPRALKNVVDEGEFDGQDKVYHLKTHEVDECFREIVRCSTEKKNPVLEVTGLYVAPASGKNGRDFSKAHSKKQSNHERQIGVSEMIFGYPEKSTGNFKRYGIDYYIHTETVKVTY